MTSWTTRIAGLALILALATPSLTMAAAPKKYQVTGKVIAVNDKTITVQKDEEKFEIERGADMKIEGDLKVGVKVTVFYHIVGDSAEVKK